ncbi:hypothetical protein ACLI4Q_11080 [Natrialbaceae archaeon A-CW1-1]
MASRNGETTPSDPEDAAIRLYHCTLPMLTKVGIVDYDRRQQTVRYREHRAVEEYLSCLEEADENVPLQTVLSNVSAISLEE